MGWRNRLITLHQHKQIKKSRGSTRDESRNELSFDSLSVLSESVAAATWEPAVIGPFVILEIV